MQPGHPRVQVVLAERPRHRVAGPGLLAGGWYSSSPIRRASSWTRAVRSRHSALYRARRPGTSSAASASTSPRTTASVHHGIGVFASAPRSDGLALSETRRVQRRLPETCAGAGGRPYLYGAHAFDADLLRTFYGAPALRRLAELRVRHALTHVNRRAFGGVRP